MTGGKRRRGTACVSRLQTRELKSTQQVEMLFDLLPPHDPQVPVDGGKWTAVDIFSFFCLCSETIRGPFGVWEWSSQLCT